MTQPAVSTRSSTSSGPSRRPRWTTRRSSATSTPSSATATSATRWPAASRSCCTTGTPTTAADIGTFLKKIAVVITSRIGGTSGPIWGTAFLRAGAKAAGKTELTGDDVVVMLRAAAEGISARGKAVLGDKTLLDALIPATDTIEAAVGRGESAAEIARAAADDHAARRPRPPSTLEAKRGRASYTGERSIGSVDAGAMALAVIAEQIADNWPAD